MGFPVRFGQVAFTQSLRAFSTSVPPKTGMGALIRKVGCVEEQLKITNERLDGINRSLDQISSNTDRTSLRFTAITVAITAVFLLSFGVSK